MRLRRGFTLIEVIIATGILMIVLVPFGSSFINASKTNAISKDKLMAIQLAQKYMEVAKRNDFVYVDKVDVDGGFTITTKVSDIADDITAYTKAVASADVNSYVGEIKFTKSKLNGVSVYDNQEIVIEINSNSVKIDSDIIVRNSMLQDSIKIVCEESIPANPYITLNVTNKTADKFNVLFVGKDEARQKITFRTSIGDGEVIKQSMGEQATEVEGEYVKKIKVTVVKNSKEIVVLDGTKKVR